MRELCTRVETPHNPHFVDIVGTGGDSAHTFNISTASAFVAAAAGATVAKHGNRSVSSKSGSADVLEALGARIDLQAPQVAECIQAVGMGFMFAPNHHPAMKNVAPVRREMGVRTIFNILGPLTNPAGAPNTLMGVFHPDLVGIQVRVMQQLGADHVMVVWGKDGMDEISLGAATMVGELKNGEITEYEIHPEDYGLQMVSNRGLRVSGAAESKEMVLEALADTPGTPREIVTLNAGAALYTANIAGSVADGIARAREAIASGAARAKLDQFVAYTQRFK
jgi:anthranilate phosphoribosyltransferase